MLVWREIKELRIKLESMVNGCVYDPVISLGEKARIIADSGLHPTRKNRLFKSLVEHLRFVTSDDKVYGNKKQLVAQLSADIRGRAFLVWVGDKDVEVREFDTSVARSKGVSAHGTYDKSDALRSPVDTDYTVVYRESLCR